MDIDTSPPRRRRGVVVVILALVAGAGIGLFWGGLPKAADRADPAESAQPEGSGSQDVAADGQPLVIVITSIRDEGDTVEIAWIDPTDGRALFVISQIVDGAAPRVLQSVPAGQTEALITGLDPSAPQYCFRVLAVLDPEHTAASATTCTPRRNLA